jgi:enamine deaminase RidA (YjgF/YER057c/UK114 family)
MSAQVLQPAEWPRPRGFSNGMTVEGPGRLIVLAGQVGSDAQGEVVAESFGEQCRAAFGNILRLLREGGAGPEHLVRMTWFVVAREEYLAGGRDIGAAWRDTFGKNFPAMSVIFVSGLIDPRAKVEIEATAWLPAPPPPPAPYPSTK